MAREVDDERLVSIVRDVLMGRLQSKDDPVDVIRSAMESVVIGLAEEMEYEDDFDPMGADTVGYEMVGIAEAFRDIAVLEDLGFDDDASDAALTVASAMVEVSCIPKYRSESAALLQSAEEIRSYVDEGSPGEWFRMDYDDLEDGDWEDSP